MCFARSFIAAPDAKGLKGAEKGLKGNHQQSPPPFGPLLPLFCPFSVTVAWHKRSRHRPTGQHDLISCQKGLDLALTRKMADGTYFAYFPFASLTEESKMTSYHKKFNFLGEVVRCGTSQKKPLRDSS